MYHRRRTTPLWILPFATFAILIGGYGMIYSKDIAASKLSKEGYRNVTMTGWQPFALLCDGKGALAQGFTGTAANGEPRSGYVCASPIYSYVVD